VLAAVNSGDVLAAVIGFGTFILGGLMNVVWLLSNMRTQIEELNDELAERRKAANALEASLADLRARLIRLETIMNGRP